MVSILFFYCVTVKTTNSKLASSDFLIGGLTVTLVYLNSSLNPFLYCWKISEVKQAVKETIREVLCCLTN